MSDTALRDLLAPARTRTRIAQALQLAASIATVVPFAGLVELARELLGPAPIEHAAVWRVVALIAAALFVRALASGAALTLTHLADLDLQQRLRTRIADLLGALPLGWFGQRNSGAVRKAAQHDVHELHYLVTHADVETTGAV